MGRLGPPWFALVRSGPPWSALGAAQLPMCYQIGQIILGESRQPSAQQSAPSLFGLPWAPMHEWQNGLAR
jgi:hypothetical protein